MPTAAATRPLVALNIPRPTEDPNTPANSALALARSLELHTPEDYQGAARILQDVKGRMGALEKSRKAIKQPLDAAVSAVQALFRPPQSTLEEAERIIKRKMTDYDDAQRRAAQEAQRKLNEQAERDRHALLKRAEKAQASGKGEKALELQERAQAVTAPVVQAATPQVQGVSLRDVAVYEITDPAALPREYLIPDEKRIGAVVRAMGLQANIPGVSVRMEKQVASRSA